jgi:hypothetical protein
MGSFSLPAMSKTAAGNRGRLPVEKNVEEIFTFHRKLCEIPVNSWSRQKTTPVSYLFSVQNHYQSNGRFDVMPECTFQESQLHFPQIGLKDCD